MSASLVVTFTDGSKAPVNGIEFGNALLLGTDGSACTGVTEDTR